MAGYNTKRVYLWGGIGNVLYQYNFALYLKSKGYNVELSAIMIKETGILSVFNNHHRGTLHFFLMLEEKLNVALILRFKLDWIDMLGYLHSKLFINTALFRYFDHITPSLKDIEESNLFLGYFQRLPWRSPLLSDAVESLVTPRFIELHQNNIWQDESLVVHLRFGDKENDPDFYLDFGLLESLFAEYKKIYVISDSPKRVDTYIENLGKNGLNVVNYCSSNILDDFLKLYMAKNLALTRSSFSWWAAELSPYNKVIYEASPFYSHLNWSPYTTKENKIYYEKY